MTPKMEHVDYGTTITFTSGKIRGEENFIARELLHLTEELGQDHLSLDLRNVNSLASAEVGTLISLHKKLKAAGGRLTLVNVNHRIGEVFERTKLNTLMEIHQGELKMPRTDPRSLIIETSLACH